MTNITKLSDYKPHLEGPAKCLGCGHEWTAVAPLGTYQFKCPECHCEKGLLCWLVAPETVWQCQCGNQHFYISDEHRAMCANCGISQEF